MAEGSPTKKSNATKLDRKGESGARHVLRATVVRSEKVKRQKKDVRNSGRRGDTGG